MTISTILANQLLVLASIMSVGVLCAKVGMFSEQTMKGLSRFLIEVATPCMIISSYILDYSSEKLRSIFLILGYSLLLNLLMIVVGWLWFRKVPERKQRILRFGVLFSNSGYMGLPLIYEVFGAEAVLYASIFMLPVNALTWSYGEALIAGTKGSWRQIVKKLLKTPALIAVGIGVLVFFAQLRPPEVIVRSLQTLGNLTAPLSMLILGEKISHIQLRTALKNIQLYNGVLVRLFVAPILSYYILRLFSPPELLLQISVVIMALPTAVATVVIAEKHDADVRFASELTVLTHILCIATVPVIAMLF